MLCIHSDKSSEVKTYFRTDSGVIESGSKLQILGFYFDANPNAVCHVTEVINKFYSKLWTLRFLRRSGMPSKDMPNVYFTVIRSTVEYCSIVYNSMIPQYMSDKLEMIQRQAMRIIYGRGVDCNKLVSDGVIEELKTRRENACIRFARKALMSPRFGQTWFPKNQVTRTARSTTRKVYEERTCRTERDRNNPIQYMIRMLNEN